MMSLVLHRARPLIEVSPIDLFFGQRLGHDDSSGVTAALSTRRLKPWPMLRAVQRRRGCSAAALAIGVLAKPTRQLGRVGSAAGGIGRVAARAARARVKSSEQRSLSRQRLAQRLAQRLGCPQTRPRRCSRSATRRRLRQQASGRAHP